MLYPQFRTRSLMILVLVSALGLMVAMTILRFNRAEMDNLKAHLRVGAFLLTPLLVLVLLKIGWSSAAE